MTTREATLLEILLVIIFRFIKRRGGCYLGNDRASVSPAALPLLLRLERRLLLLFIVIEDCRAVLGSDIRSLPVQRCRVVVVPEHGKHVFIRQAIAVVGH